MDEQYVYRIVNPKTGAFYRSRRNQTHYWGTWSGVRTALRSANNPTLVIKKYRLVEVE